jgi:hypothetical protein
MMACCSPTSRSGQRAQVWLLAVGAGTRKQAIDLGMPVSLHGYTAPFECRVLLRGGEDGEDLRAARLFTRQRRCILQNLRKLVEELVRKLCIGWDKPREGDVRAAIGS